MDYFDHEKMDVYQVASVADSGWLTKPTSTPAVNSCCASSQCSSRSYAGRHDGPSGTGSGTGTGTKPNSYQKVTLLRCAAPCSTSMAMPMPPPMHSAAIPSRAPRRCIS